MDKIDVSIGELIDSFQIISSAKISLEYLAIELENQGNSSKRIKKNIARLDDVREKLLAQVESFVAFSSGS